MQRFLSLLLVASLTCALGLAQAPGSTIEPENRSAVEWVAGRAMTELAEQVPPEGKRVLILPVRGDAGGFTRGTLAEEASRRGFTVASGPGVAQALETEAPFFEGLQTLDLADPSVKEHLTAFGEVDGFLWGWLEQLSVADSAKVDMRLTVQYHEVASGHQLFTTTKRILAPLTQAAALALILVGVLLLILVILVIYVSRRLRKRAQVKELRARAQTENEIDLALNEDRELRNRITREVATARQIVREAELAAEALDQGMRDLVRQTCSRLEGFSTTVERAEFGNARRFKEGKLPTSALEQLADFTRTLDALSHDIGVEATGLSGAISAGQGDTITDCCGKLQKALDKLSRKFSERLDYLRGL